MLVKGYDSLGARRCGHAWRRDSSEQSHGTVTGVTVRIRSPLLIRLSGILFANAMRALFWTLQLDIRTARKANPYAPSGSACFIYVVWHDSIIMAAFGGKHMRTVALTSHHRDGSFVASVLHAIGVTAVRGSTNHRGSNALRAVLTAEGHSDVVMTPDGPRGPRRQMSRGTVFLASRSGRAIVPTAFSCEKSWTIRGSWTDLVIPRPFSRVFLLAGEPIEVPMDLPRDKLAQYAARIQTHMDGLGAHADRLASARRSRAT
jgi:lysophospholipid acyltransferase (LPLAT)-like uncharacterized protein